MTTGSEATRMSGDAGTYLDHEKQGYAASADATDIAMIPRITIHAFCLEDRTMHVVEAATEDRRMLKAHMKAEMGGIPAAIDMFEKAPTPNLIVVETSGAREDLLQSLDQLAEYCDAGTKVIVIGDVNDVTLYRDLISRGVSEYLITPVSIFQLIGSISNLYNDPEAEPLGERLHSTV
jgi:pilus assembly protein CpaE